MVEGPAVHHHVLLEHRGGASAVARMLAGSGQFPASVSFELAEPGVEAFPGAFQCAPASLARAAPAGSIVHVHATQDWPALLQGFAGGGRNLVITVHDCTLLTGGCVYPVECPLLPQGCPDPCPRGFADSACRRQRKRKSVLAARPVLASPSAWLARQLREAWPGLNVRVIPNGVAWPHALLDKLEARSRLGIDAKAKVALFLAHGGTEAAYKGGGRFEALWAGIKAGEAGALGMIAGGQEMARQGDLLLLPYLEGEHLAMVLRAADVLVSPTVADNHPLVVLQAMAYALPVAAYAVGGIPEQIISGSTGLLVPVWQEEALVAAVLTVLADSSLARRLGHAARESVAKHFRLERMVADYAKLYARLEGHPGSGAG